MFYVLLRFRQGENKQCLQRKGLLKQDSDLFVFIQPVPGDWSAFEVLSILFRYCFDLWPSGEFSAEKERERCLVKEKKAVCRDGSSMVRPFDKLPPQAGRSAIGERVRLCLPVAGPAEQARIWTGKQGKQTRHSWQANAKAIDCLSPQPTQSARVGQARIWVDRPAYGRADPQAGEKAP
jgi:hypothetical protein